MSANGKRTLLVTLVAGCIGLANATQVEEPVMVDATNLRPSLARRVEAEAAKGITALSRFVHRTRSMHQLDLDELIVSPEKAEAMRAKALRIAAEKSPAAPLDTPTRPPHDGARQEKAMLGLPSPRQGEQRGASGGSDDIDGSAQTAPGGGSVTIHK